MEKEVVKGFNVINFNNIQLYKKHLKSIQMSVSRFRDPQVCCHF